MNPYLIYLPVLAVIIIYTFRMLEIWKKRDLIQGEIKDSFTLKLFKMVGLYVVVAAIAEYFYFNRSINWYALVAGIVVASGSFYLRNLAIKALGKFWSLNVEIRTNHQFIQEGPFRFVRHPAYTSMIMEILAVCVILEAPISLATALILFLPVLRKRIRIEETELTKKFGEAYADYKKRVPALIPIKL